MDLEEFEVNHRGSDTTANHATSSLSIPDALKWMDGEWHTTSRRARWMDLLGDYAGTEPFIIDGHSLIQLVISDPLLALGKTGDPSFQILHAFHTLERTLDQFIKRSAVFDVVFWEENRHVTLKSGVGAFEDASRSLARKLLFNHLLKIRRVSVYVFTGLSDPKWREYQFVRKPMFALVNDGDTDQVSIDPFATQRLLFHRVFLCDLLTSGLALALLASAEFRDSKVLSFVYESKSRRADDFIPASVRSAYSTAARVLEGEAEDFALVPSPTSIDPLPTLRALAIEDVVLKVASLTRFHDARNKALLFAFLIHLTLLPHLSTQERARRLEPMKAGFKHQLASSFLPNIFHAMEVAITSLNTTIDIDVRVFIALVRFLAENNTYSVQDIFGNEATKIVQDRLALFSVPISTFSQFAVEFLPFPALASPPIENGLGLLPFSNKIFDDELAPIRSLGDDDGAGAHRIDEREEDEGIESKEGSDADEWDASSEEEETSASATKALPEVPRTGYFDDGTLFNDTRHWHNHKKPLLPKHLGGEALLANATEWQRRKKLRADQRFIQTLHDQAATLTGASGAALHQLKILPVGAASNQLPSKPQKQSYKRPASKAKQKQSKADVIHEEYLAQKAQKQINESIEWLAKGIHDLDSETSPSSLETSLSNLRRNAKFSEPFVATELGLYHLHRLFQHWILDPERESASVRDKHAVTALRTIKDILEVNYSTNDIRQCIQDVLNVLGFSAYTYTLTIASTTQEDRPLSFKFVKLVKSKTKEPLYAFMRIREHPIEWQLRVFGEYMDRSMDSQVDPRVSFKPDAWQRQVLDAIDDNKSLLVVAPTSAGKTFISYYAMEKVLRGSDEGIIVYVAPTKALVAQVAAEIYARFSKDLKGRNCWAIYTRDYRIHEPQNCQILVTVPDMLAIMMLSPPLTKVWTPRVKYIILDEIHAIGQQEGGSVWEQILLLAPCPIIGLSATVGAPEKFNTWLEAVQRAGRFQHTFVHHPHRYSHLRKFFYNIHEKPSSTFESISTYKSTGRMRYLHPIAMLAFGPRTIPSDLALEASDTLTLYQALMAHGDLPPSTLDTLDPLNFFPSDRLLQQTDVIRYDAALKACLVPMVDQFDPRNTAAPLYKVIASLEDVTLSRVPTEVINTQPERTDFKNNLIHLVCDLHAQGDLPAIFFNFDRADCEIMAQTLHHALLLKETEWRASNVEWKRKLAQYDEWLSKAKDRERAAARAAKNRVDLDGVKTETVEWQATFDPTAPLPQFSFSGEHTSRTSSTLEEELKQLAHWTSTPLKWTLSCLRRGIAVHHSGMHKRYRILVESLFRQGFIRIIFATGTLALGINAPTKTSIFCGDSPYLTALVYRQCAGRAGRRGYDLLGKVVFYGLPMDRVQRLTLSKLPSLGAGFPVTSTLVLRLFNLLEGSGYAPAAISAIQRLFRLPQVSFDSEEGKHQLLHHLRFSIDYLRRARLLDEHGRPFNLIGIASQLYYTEPSNFALVTLLRHGVVHRICAQLNVIQAKREFILLMSHLFGRRYLPGSYLKDPNMAEMIKKSASMVILPPLPDDARRVLAAHEDEILRIFTGYTLTYGSERSAELGPDTRLPLSGTRLAGTPTFRTGTRFGAWLQETALRVVVRSLFVANSGHDDRFESVSDLAKTARKGLNLNQHAIPSLAPIFAMPARTESGGLHGDKNGNQRSGHPSFKAHAHGFALNAYILDFYTHGQEQALSEANGIRRGDIWFLLQEFVLTLKTVRGVLEQLIMRKREGVDGREGSDIGEGEGEGLSDDLDSGFMDVEDPTERNGEAEDDVKGRTRAAQVGSVVGGVKPSWVAESDWRVLQVVDEATEDFDEKFQAMWA
ncbi:P-loop containing nucleoside triphosphate hydrolase protein [Imleria badia]|nr:P-loop containing nucleoside triphosphate hydrolase protein [Imleria badia]